MPPRAFNEDGGKEPKAPARVELPDVEVPKTREDFAKVMNKGLARAMEMATSAKELTEALKAGTEWFQVLYPKDETGGGWGSGLPGQNGAKTHA